MIFEKKQVDEAFVDSVMSQLTKEKPNIGFDYMDFAELKRANEIISYTGSKDESDYFSDDDFVKRVSIQPPIKYVFQPFSMCF